MVTSGVPRSASMTPQTALTVALTFLGRIRGGREGLGSEILNKFEDLALKNRSVQVCKTSIPGSNPGGASNLYGCIPDTWVTDYSGDIGNSYGTKGLSIGSSLQVSSSKYPARGVLARWLRPA